MDFFVRHWYVLVGSALGIWWVALFLNRHRIESPWVRAFLGLSLESPLFKAAMQGRKDFTRREVWGWAVVVLIAAIAIFVEKFWF